MADQLGHARPSMMQDVYLARRAVDSQAATALEAGLRGLWFEDQNRGKPWEMTKARTCDASWPATLYAIRDSNPEPAD